MLYEFKIKLEVDWKVVTPSLSVSIKAKDIGQAYAKLAEELAGNIPVGIVDIYVLNMRIKY